MEKIKQYNKVKTNYCFNPNKWQHSFFYCFRGKPVCFSVNCGLCLSLSEIHNWQHKTVKLTAGAYCTKPIDLYGGLQKYANLLNFSTFYWNILWKTNTKFIKLWIVIKLFIFSLKTEKCYVQKVFTPLRTLVESSFAAVTAASLWLCLYQFCTSGYQTYFPIFFCKTLQYQSDQMERLCERQFLDLSTDSWLWLGLEFDWAIWSHEYVSFKTRPV